MHAKLHESTACSFEVTPKARGQAKAAGPKLNGHHVEAAPVPAEPISISQIAHAVSVIQSPPHEQSSTCRIHALLDLIASRPKTDDPDDPEALN